MVHSFERDSTFRCNTQLRVKIWDGENLKTISINNLSDAWAKHEQTICSPFHGARSFWPVNQVNRDRQVFWFQTSALTETTCYCQFHSSYLLGHMCIHSKWPNIHTKHVNHSGGGARETEVRSYWWNMLWIAWGSRRDSWKHCYILFVMCYLWWLIDFNSILLV